MSSHSQYVRKRAASDAAEPNWRAKRIKRDAIREVEKAAEERIAKIRTIPDSVVTKSMASIQFMYIVMSINSEDDEQAYEQEVQESRVLDVYTTLEDANSRVRNECATTNYRTEEEHAEYFIEDLDANECLWWEYQNEDHEGIKVFVVKKPLKTSEPVRDWGRDIGEPFPEEEEEEEEDEDEDDERDSFEEPDHDCPEDCDGGCPELYR